MSDSNSQANAALKLESQLRGLSPRPLDHVSEGELLYRCGWNAALQAQASARMAKARKPWLPFAGGLLSGVAACWLGFLFLSPLASRTTSDDTLIAGSSSQSSTAIARTPALPSGTRVELEVNIPPLADRSESGGMLSAQELSGAVDSDRMDRKLIRESHSGPFERLGFPANYFGLNLDSAWTSSSATLGPKGLSVEPLSRIARRQWNQSAKAPRQTTTSIRELPPRSSLTLELMRELTEPQGFL